MPTCRRCNREWPDCGRDDARDREARQGQTWLDRQASRWWDEDDDHVNHDHDEADDDDEADHDDDRIG